MKDKNYIEISDNGKERLNKLPFTLRYLANYLIETINSLINGDCDEKNVASAIGTLRQNAEGKVGKADTVNYDGASKILGFCATNRSGLKKTLDKYGIKQVIINNQRCGFLRSDVTALRDKLDEDIRNAKKSRWNRSKR